MSAAYSANRLVFPVQEKYATNIRVGPSLSALAFGAADGAGLGGAADSAAGGGAADGIAAVLFPLSAPLQADSDIAIANAAIKINPLFISRPPPFRYSSSVFDVDFEPIPYYYDGIIAVRVNSKSRAFFAAQKIFTQGGDGAMTIAEVCKKVGLTADTLRYYERIGLIPNVNRTAGGIRDYTEYDCGWIEFIKCMRGAGVQVESLVEYVELFRQGDSTAGERKQILVRERSRIARQLVEMQNTLERLDFKIEKYETVLRDAEDELQPVANRGTALSGLVAAD
jgi:DNA-binding transcriptional MerR regulator